MKDLSHAVLMVNRAEFVDDNVFVETGVGALNLYQYEDNIVVKIGGKDGLIFSKADLRLFSDMLADV